MNFESYSSLRISLFSYYARKYEYSTIRMIQFQIVVIFYRTYVRKMSLNTSRNFLSFSIILEVLISGSFAIVSDSPAVVTPTIEEKNQDQRFSNRNVLCNAFENNYSIKAQDKDSIKLFQPLLIDYTFLQYFYVDTSDTLWNPIRSFELLNAKFYFESSALIEKSREEVFTDFYIKYNAAFTFLHLWITRFIIRHTISLIPKDKAEEGKTIHETFLFKLDEMAFYAQWLVNVEVHRQLYEIDSTLRSSVSKNHELHKAVAAFEKIIKTLNALIKIEPFLSLPRQRIFEFFEKINSYNKRVAPVEIKEQDEKWMRIVQHIEDVKLQKKSHVDVENFFEHSYDDYDKNYRLEHEKDPRKYMKYLHDNSWAAINRVIGEELFIMESFFYSSLVGEPYTLSESFVTPGFNNFTKELWKELECIYYFWMPITATLGNKIDMICKNSINTYYLKGPNEKNEIYLIKILRDMDSLRFRKFYLLNSNAVFKLETCREWFFLFGCHGRFRMVG